MSTTTCFVNTLPIKTVDKTLSYYMHVWSYPPPHYEVLSDTHKYQKLVN